MSQRRTLVVRAALVAACATLNACPQLRDEDFRTLPGDMLSRPDAGGGAGGNEAGAGGEREPPLKHDAGVMPPGPPGPEERIAALRAALAHRYAFDGTGTIAVDSIAGSNATLVGATLDGSGGVVLDGDGPYVDLPNGVLSSVDEQTIEAWLIWNGGRAWQRIFDFGSSDGGEGERGNGRTYLFLTPRTPGDVMLLAYSASGYAGETRLNADVAFPVGILAQVTVVIDSPHDALSLYLDGRWLATQTLEQRLSALDDVNCWIGMAQYQSDPSLSATLTDFRLYHRALTREEIELSHMRGPDATF